ncbi:MAG: hypothetical protein GEU28_11805 [Dehalococcoidia bacterium]|nr:hypothetical protein [Dehalococcoidia bacterium]
MNENTAASVDLAVSPLSSFDEAVSFGDALYGLDGVTRLALNEFEDGRASFTFSARSLSSVTDGLAGLGQFSIARVDTDREGRVQVQLAGAQDEPQVVDWNRPEPAQVAEPAYKEQAPVEQPVAAAQSGSYREEEYPVGSAPTSYEEPAYQSAESEPGAFEEEPVGIEPAEASPEYSAEEPREQPAAFNEEQEEEHYALSGVAGTPVEDENVSESEYAFDQASESAQASEARPAIEVAQLIAQLAKELKATADNLIDLAARITEGEAVTPEPGWPGAPEASFGQAPLEDLEDEADSWSRPEAETPTAEEPSQEEWRVPGPEPLAEEPRAWEAPRMPSVGMNPSDVLRPQDFGRASAPSESSYQPLEADSDQFDPQAEALAAATGRSPVRTVIKASGFPSFSLANDFISSVRRIPGALKVGVDELEQGRLVLTVDYFGATGIEEQLQMLGEFPHRVVNATPDEVTIQVEFAG